MRIVRDYKVSATKKDCFGELDEISEVQWKEQCT